MGIQQVRNWIQEEYNITPTLIESDKTNSPNKIRKTQQNIHDKKSEIIIGTSLLTTPIKDLNIDLVIFLNADIGLNIPDYTAAEKNFYFLYEAIRNYQTANFIIQSFNTEQYSIRSACKMDTNLLEIKIIHIGKNYNILHIVIYVYCFTNMK